MFHRLSLLIIIFTFSLLEASCIPENQTEIKQGVVYVLDSEVPFEGCIVQAYPDGQKKSELFYLKGKPTGEGRRWYENGPKQSEITHKSGKMHTKKLWNYEGYMYAFERYKDGIRIHPVEMAYTQAKKACRRATFHGHGDWKLPSVEELYEVPFSEETKEMTYIASNPPHYVQSIEKVSYVRFGSAPNDVRWDNDDLSINNTLNVICITDGNPKEFHLVMGSNKIADLTSEYMDGNVRVKAIKQVPVRKKPAFKRPSTAKKYDAKQVYVPKKEDIRHVTAEEIKVLKEATVTKKMERKQAPVEEIKRPKEVTLPKKEDIKQKNLRSGYYISIYTYSSKLPEKELLDRIMNAGYRYKLSDFTRDGIKTKNVLIGPFPTEYKAVKELKRVHQKLEPDAYIIDNTY